MELLHGLEVSAAELEALVEQVREPLGEAGYQKLKAAIRTLGYVTELLESRETTLQELRRMLCRDRTEKTEAVLKRAGIHTDTADPAGTSAEKTKAPGHGRNGNQAYRGARKLTVAHPALRKGDRCPECAKGRCTARLLQLWCGSSDKRRSRPPSMRWKSFAAIFAVRCSRPNRPKGWDRRSTMRRR